MGLFSKKVSHKAGQVDKSRLPRHIAIVMDGNGRWAKKRGLPRTAGHKVGAETFRKIALYCKALGVEYLTIYAFSTENWKRPADEVSTLMGLPCPNLGTGGFNYHGPCEGITVEAMDKATEILLNLADIYKDVQ